MNKYQKIIDYDKNEAHYFCNDNGIAIEVSKDIIIDDLQDRINKAIELIDEPIYYVTDKMETPRFFIKRLKEVKDILQGEDNDNK